MFSNKYSLVCSQQGLNLSQFTLKVSIIILLTNTLIVGVGNATSTAQNAKKHSFDLSGQILTQNLPKPESPVNNNEVNNLDSRDYGKLQESILAEINRVRTNPQGYADWLEAQKKYFQGNTLELPGEKPIRSNKGRDALEEAITWLQKLEPLSTLASSSQLVNTAKEQIDTSISNQESNNSQQVNISYGKYTAEGIVMQLVVDDGYPDRPHRRSILNPNIQLTGIICDAHEQYDTVCAIAYPGDSTITAENSESKESTLIPNTEVNQAQPEVEVPTKEESTEKLPNNNHENLLLPSLPVTNNRNNNSLLLEKIQRGRLENGDRIIPNDGSFYDSYPLEGKEGDSFIISVESEDFDTFLAIMDDKGNILEQNDDIRDGNSNSRLRVTLPSSGVYNVIVNAYDEGGQGKYLLTVRR